jgi:type IV secretion system protein VirD4
LVDKGGVLLLLDEFAALGRLEAAERAFGLMAGYGVQLWAILQDLHQLNAAYGAAAGTFLSNAALIQIFNVGDVETATWVSRMLGVTTEAYQTTSQSKSSTFGKLSTTQSRSTNLHLVKRDLMTPDEVMRMGADRMLVLRPGHAPLVGRKVRYYADAEFAGRFDA